MRHVTLKLLRETVRQIRQDIVATVERWRGSGQSYELGAAGLLAALDLAELNLDFATRGLSITASNMAPIKPRNLVRDATRGRWVLISAEMLALSGVTMRFAMIAMADVLAEGGGLRSLPDKYGLGAEHIAARALAFSDAA